MLKPLALLFITATLAQAEDAAVLATLAASSGSLPPQYAWTVAVTVRTDGLVTVTRCTGYEKTEATCKTGQGQAVSGTLDAIRAAATASGLAQRPAKMLDPPMVGGGSLSGSVTLDGQSISLVDQPVAADAERVKLVLDVIGSAIPAELEPILSGD